MAESTETTGANGSSASDSERKFGQLAGGVVGVMETARGAAGDIANQLPTAAGATRQVMDQASRQMQSSSDEMLLVGSAMAFGIAAGLFLSGANRLLVTIALVPATAMGATLLDRRTRQGDFGG